MGRIKGIIIICTLGKYLKAKLHFKNTPYIVGVPSIRRIASSQLVHLLMEH